MIRMEMICIEKVVRAANEPGMDGGCVGVWGGREAGVECLYGEVQEPLLIRGKLG